MTVFSNTPYYHKSIEALITAFGSFFTGINVTRANADGTTAQTIIVPIGYGPRNKWLERIHAQPDPASGPNVQVTMPRLSYEITDYKYDSSRKIGYKGAYNNATTDAGYPTRIFNPVPYDISFQLASFTKDQGMALQILEQILPYFAPSITLSVNVLPEFNMMKDIPIVLKSVNVDDTYEGGTDSLRTVIQTFEFVAKIDLFGPIDTKRGVIKTTLVDIGGMDPQADWERNTQAVNPAEANKEDTYTINEQWDNLL